MKRHATAHWSGNLKEGTGDFSTQSGTIAGMAYDFGRRFGDAMGSNPEELIAAAHAACFAMATSAELEKAGIVAEAIDTKAEVTLDTVGGAPTVTASHLSLSLTAPGADRASAEKAVNDAKAGCPISRLLAGSAQITLDATYSV